MEAVLIAPVALASSTADFGKLNRQGGQVEELPARADQGTIAAEIRTGAPIAASAVVNFAALERGIDDVFERIERMGDDLVGRAGATRFAEWLVIAGGACAAFEYARIRFREAGPWQSAPNWPVLSEPRLRRRWLPGRSRR